MHWQPTLRLALGVFFLGLLVVVFATMRSRRTPDAPPTITRADPSAAVELPKGADIVWTDKGREVFTLKFDRALTYQDGRSVFSGADITVPGREDGRVVHIKAKQAEVFAPTGQPRRVEMQGGVELSSSEGLHLRAPRAEYSEGDRILRIPGAFTFERGRTSGSGQSAQYYQDTDVLHVLNAARVQVTAAEGTEPLDIRAGAATMNRPQHLVRFERDVTVLSGTQTITAATLVAHLSDDEQQLTGVELRGNSRIVDSAAAVGALRSMSASEIDLTYAADGRTLDRASLRGQSSMQIAAAGAADRRLAAETIDADVGADGRTLQLLNARQNVQLDLPAENEVPARRIRSAALDGTGGDEGLRDVTFSGGVDYHETRAASGSAAAVDRTARSERLDAALAPGLGPPERALFRGRVTIRDGDTTAEAALARYAPDRGVLTLETPAGATPPPRVTDAQVTVAAAWIELTLSPRRLHAKGDVRSIIQPTDATGERSDVNSQNAEGSRKPEGGRPAAAARKRPAMLNEKQPINVTAAELIYDAAASTGTYSGGARLWQGEATTIQAVVLIIDDAAGNLTAREQARTRMMLEQIDPKTKARELVESNGSADVFVYVDAARHATYTGDAHLTGPQGDVTAVRIELFLNEDGRTLDRAEAYENVVARFEGGQQASGTRLTYTGADERYVMSGSPVKILEIVENGCRETLGASLTFIRSTDTINVVGTEGNRSRTMPGRCAERALPPRDRENVRR